MRNTKEILNDSKHASDPQILFQLQLEVLLDIREFLQDIIMIYNRHVDAIEVKKSPSKSTCPCEECQNPGI